MTRDDFEDLLNETSPEVVICGITFSAGSIFRKMDPVAFDVEYWSVVHSMEENEEIV